MSDVREQAIRRRRYDWFNQGSPAVEDARAALAQWLEDRAYLLRLLDAERAETARLRALLKQHGVADG